MNEPGVFTQTAFGMQRTFRIMHSSKSEHVNDPRVFEQCERAGHGLAPCTPRHSLMSLQKKATRTSSTGKSVGTVRGLTTAQRPLWWHVKSGDPLAAKPGRHENVTLSIAELLRPVRTRVAWVIWPGSGQSISAKCEEEKITSVCKTRSWNGPVVYPANAFDYRL